MLGRFDEEFERSRIRRKFVLETADATARETLQLFLQEMEPHLTDRDQRALLVHAHLR